MKRRRGGLSRWAENTDKSAATRVDAGLVPLRGRLIFRKMRGNSTTGWRGRPRVPRRLISPPPGGDAHWFERARIEAGEVPRGCAFDEKTALLEIGNKEIEPVGLNEPRAGAQAV